MGDLLFLAHRVPFPPDRGDKIRSYNILKHLAGKRRVHLAAFADDDADIAAAEALRPMVGRLHVERRARSRASAAAIGLARGQAISVAAFASPMMTRFVKAVAEEETVDGTYIFSGQMAQYAPAGRPFAMDFVDMDSEKFAAYAASAHGPMRWVWRREAERLFAFEREVAARAAVSLFVSDAEAALFRDRTGLPDTRARALENGIDLDRYRPAPHRRGETPLIVFTGQMDYPPNIEAAAGFARDVMPSIRARHPDARFAIVGRKPDACLSALDGRNGVEVTGEVPDVRPWLTDADVVVAPLRIARGVQNKVLEAMAMARPVVASPQAFEGIDAAPDRDLIVAGGARAEAEAVLALLADPVRAETIGAAARARVEARYAWKARLAALDDLLERF
ncbi:TIGR03087 family PEP-CTERM/XrtA system glycosyltransferase [Sphingomonas oligoaromativorans]|uniref:TIGR03087 family PEP-CTERM/XrtA system glycosyltransferase n=1 Tax=Sphingomonas oligoaromativorans TaxID=575322 RepID=UPI001420661C|nr:TIGR03087 family PEP-CTERM/XrtA system glycosyltransferase [Sphingomonas oligoaromativorans]NIJ32356.1 sugar transferase (PEP-CTERM/EpsH1 system associated) [Sphingomonas oligoaromativorans]